MLSLIRARLPTIALWTSLEAGFIGFVAYQWSGVNEIHTPLKSAIPAGHIGAVRFHHSHPVSGKTLAPSPA
ncbi:hypothetical protein EIP91_006340 [Steccherinum ochraceum]|uniref:Uncharacterized protein n=1 Tax=Steccherinum ochraceum TaxID=92696 RepID=A0A4R0REA0_9APHY|nr:hypothetical protein EIP91_006340 [Steccherinum ochraceum]